MNVPNLMTMARSVSESSVSSTHVALGSEPSATAADMTKAPASRAIGPLTAVPLELRKFGVKNTDGNEITEWVRQKKKLNKATGSAAGCVRPWQWGGTDAAGA